MDQERFQKQIKEYISDTLTFIKTVRDFCGPERKWTIHKEFKIKKQKGEEELKALLKDTVEELEQLQPFLDAVEKLAVTSLFVFTDDRLLPSGVSAVAVRSVISAARIVSSSLIVFKRDAGAFFLPNLDNIDVLDFWLHKYVCIAKWLCKKMKNTSLQCSLDSMQTVTDHLSQLSTFRMDESFRLTFIFDGNAQEFIETYSECRTRMFEFLSGLEEAAVQLDRMQMGSSISTVAGSSVSAVGGICYFTGLALAPYTAGTSLALTGIAFGLGVTSGVNSLVTGVTGHFVNAHHSTKANCILQKFMEDMQKVQDCLEQAASSQHPRLHLDEGNVELAITKGKDQATTVCKNITKMTSVTKAMETLKENKEIGMAGSLGLQGANTACRISEVAADVPDLGQLAKGTSVALSNAARYGLMGMNAVLIGMDARFIYKESINLCKGEESERSRFIRSRSALWCSEIQAWDNIYICLCEGKDTFERNLEILEQPFTTDYMI